MKSACVGVLSNTFLYFNMRTKGIVDCNFLATAHSKDGHWLYSVWEIRIPHRHRTVARQKNHMHFVFHKAITMSSHGGKYKKISIT